MIKSPVRSSIEALSQVRFEVNPGEVCALVGPNGAGKTTLFRILIGLTTPTSGHASVLGRDVVADSLAIRRRVGWMPTSTQTLFHRHTVSDNLKFQARVYGLPKQKVERAIDEILELVELGHAKNHAVVSLSTGMQARLRFARSMLHQPQLLILDEPTASVDPLGSLKLINLILSVVKERNISAIVSSHRLDEIETLHSHVLLMDQGALLFDGDLDVLRSRTDRRRYEIEFSSAAAATRAATVLKPCDGVSELELERTLLSFTLAPDERLGTVMARLGPDLPAVVSAQRVELPLRAILADVYGAVGVDKDRP